MFLFFYEYNGRGGHVLDGMIVQVSKVLRIATEAYR